MVKQLQQHPLRIKVIAAGVLSAISDIVSQKLTGIQKLQLRRLLLKVVFGAAYLGPFGHFFHLILDKIFKGKRDSKTVAKKEKLQNLLFNLSIYHELNSGIAVGTCVINLLFIGSTKYQLTYAVQHLCQPWVNVKAKDKKDYPSVQYTAWTTSPVVGWINHKFLPLHFRVVFQSLAAFFWYVVFVCLSLYFSFHDLLMIIPFGKQQLN
ncbi:Peroxisomal membrane protein PMP22 [Glycine soja]|uniref:Peroxisomal membrane protein PMP22 n=1 Tax=Glycine soja TaxID=3848 RepID=A0A445IVA5_GLYSO|nr:Peroxisomal membrane protein PMP22 [Glycine soja]